MSTDDPIKLDGHRGMLAQKATELRRLQHDVRDNEAQLRARQDELQTAMIATPADTWETAAQKAEYLISLLAGPPEARDPRMEKLIAAVLDDFTRLSKQTNDI
jgi:hypothetical protein